MKSEQLCCHIKLPHLREMVPRVTQSRRGEGGLTSKQILPTFPQWITSEVLTSEPRMSLIWKKFWNIII